MLYRKLTHLAWNDRDSRVLLAVVALHDRRPPVTTADVDDLLGRPGRRNVERAIKQLAADGLLEVRPGRPRLLVPTVRMVPWADPSLPSSVAASPAGAVTARRMSLRGSGRCDHPLSARFGKLCTICGEPLDSPTSTGVPSTAV